MSSTDICVYLVSWFFGWSFVFIKLVYLVLSTGGPPRGPPSGPPGAGPGWLALKYLLY